VGHEVKEIQGEGKKEKILIEVHGVRGVVHGIEE
jgi:hypothetical protein